MVDSSAGRLTPKLLDQGLSDTTMAAIRPLLNPAMLPLFDAAPGGLKAAMVSRLGAQLGARAEHRQREQHQVGDREQAAHHHRHADRARRAGQSPTASGSGRVVGIFVNRYDGLGLHTLARVRSMLGRDLRKVVFLSVAQVDSDQFRNEEHLQTLVASRRRELERYESLVREAGLEAVSHYRIGTDVVEELEKLALETAERESGVYFIAGQVVFQRENLSTRVLHNDVAFALQRRLIFRGLDMLILQRRLVVGIEIRRQGGETERREQRVLDRSPVRAGRFSQRGQDEFHPHAVMISQTTLYYKVNRCGDRLRARGFRWRNVLSIR